MSLTLDSSVHLSQAVLDDETATDASENTAQRYLNDRGFTGDNKMQTVMSIRTDAEHRNKTSVEGRAKVVQPAKDET